MNHAENENRSALLNYKEGASIDPTVADARFANDGGSCSCNHSSAGQVATSVDPVSTSSSDGQ